MSAGHIVNGQCVDVAASADAYFSTVGTSIVPGATTYLSYPNRGSDGVWTLITQYYTTGPGLSFRGAVVAPVPAFPSCDTETLFNDGMTYVYAIIALWVAVWAAKAVYNLFRLPSNDAF